MKNFIRLFCLFILFFQFVVTIPALADVSGGGNANASAASQSASTQAFPNPLAGINTPQQFIGKIISSLLGVVGSIALLMFVYGGFIWMTARGNSKAIDEGKNIIIWATIGLVVIFTSYAMVKFIFSGIGA